MKKYGVFGTVAAATVCAGLVAVSSPASGQVGFGQRDPVVATGRIGFDATQRAFTLPHGLGLLPGPNLALAKADPAYAAGLVNPQDWGTIEVRMGQSTTDLKGPFLFWTYVGSSSNSVGGTYSPFHLYIEVKNGVPESWTDFIA